MDSINKITQEHISEFEGILKTHREQKDRLISQMLNEQKSSSIDDLSKKYDALFVKLYETQKQERKAIIDKHEKEYQDFLVFREAKLKLLQEEMQVEIDEGNAQRAEERDNFKKQEDSEKQQSKFESLRDRILKMKGQSKSLEKDKDIER